SRRARAAGGGLAPCSARRAPTRRPPPGSSAASLEPLIRFFTLPTHVAPGEQPTYLRNPWTTSFTSGTQIARGLDLARQIARDNRIRKPSVVLISDLADDPNDSSRLNDVLEAYRHDGVK